MVSAALLARHRAVQERFMPDICTVSVRSLSDDASGGDAETWTVTATVACRMAPSSGGGGTSGIQLTGLVEAVETFDVTLPVTTAVAEGNRIGYLNVETGGTTVFQVIGSSDRGSFPSAIRALCVVAPGREDA